MSVISFDKLFPLIKSQRVPKDYTLRTPVVIKYSEFLIALNSFKNTEELIYFINAICSQNNVVINSNKNTYTINTHADFLFIYLVSRIEKHLLSPDKNLAIRQLLDNIIFSREQLYLLLQRLPAAELEYLLLKTKSISEEFLLEAVNNIDIVRSLSFNIIGRLYYYYNPKHEWKLTPSPYLDMYYLAIRVGHIIGIKNKIVFKVRNAEFKLDTEGEYASTSLDHLTQYLQRYVVAYPSITFDAICKAFALSNSLILPNLNEYKKGSAECFYKEYNNNELICFSTGWFGHVTSVTLYGDYLVYTNRGESGVNDKGCRIFKIKNKADVTPELLDNLISDEIADRKQFNAILGSVVDLDDPVVIFKSKTQKYGTCSFVNPKSSVEAMIVLLQAGPLASVEKVIEQSTKESSREKYKTFTSFIRNCEIDELVKNMPRANNPYLVEFYAALVKKIIYQHCGGTLERAKDVEEYNRAGYLYKNLPDQIMDILFCDDEFDEFMGEIGCFDDVQPVLYTYPPYSSGNINESSHKLDNTSSGLSEMMSHLSL